MTMLFKFYAAFQGIVIYNENGILVIHFNLYWVYFSDALCFVKSLKTNGLSIKKKPYKCLVLLLQEFFTIDKYIKETKDLMINTDKLKQLAINRYEHITKFPYEEFYKNGIVYLKL